MATESGVDLAAVARVARNIDLRDIRVIKIDASCSPAPEEPLEPRVTFDTQSSLVTDKLLNVVCVYDFAATAGGKQVATAKIVYLMMYEVTGQMIAEKDIEPFAAANGVYHSWPFLRQLLFDLTSKMGLPALTLPVFQVLPRAQPEQMTAGDAPEVKPTKRKATQKKQLIK